MEQLNKCNIELINPQPIKENPLIVDNYPYGFKRTQASYYIDTQKKKGQRVIFTTLNPKTNLWNKEKKANYCDIVVLYRNRENNHIENTALSFAYDDINTLNYFLDIFESCLNDYQREQIKVFRAIIETRKYVKMSIKENPTEEEYKQIEENNKKVNESLHKIFNYNLNREVE
jgi:hypothetical protein